MNAATLSSLSELTASVATTDSRESLFQALQTTLAVLGFDSFNMGCHKSDRYELILEPTLASWPEEFMEEYRLNGYAEIDPILDRAVVAEEPFVWSVQDEFGDRRQQEYMEFLKGTPLKGGALIPLPRRKGTISSISVETHVDCPPPPEAIDGAAVIAQFALLKAEMLGLCPPAEQSAGAETLEVLSAHQIEIMHWVAAGKTNSEIAIIMSVSERSIKYHMGEILRKWNISSRSQAVQVFGKLQY